MIYLRPHLHLSLLILASQSSSTLLSSKDCTDCPLLVQAYSSSTVYSDIDSFTITTSVTNLSPTSLKLLEDPRTVLSSWATHTFTITKENRPIPNANAETAPPAPASLSPLFRGVAVRFLPSSVLNSANSPTMTLGPRESVQVVHEVGRYYDFSESGPGEYTFTPSDRFFEVIAPGAVERIRAKVIPALVFLPPGQLRSYKPLSAWSLGGPALSQIPFLPKIANDTIASDSTENNTSTLLAPRAAPPKSSSSSDPTINSSPTCSSAQLKTIKGAMRVGADLARKAAEHLNAHKHGSELQTTWYGRFSGDAHRDTLDAFSTLRELFSAASSNSRFSGQGPIYDCTTCTSPHTYAYVYPSQFPKIFLCGLFWDAPEKGSGSRADTLIHEGTHFEEVMGSTDIAYGETKCRELAQNDPEEAVWNADNHAFFSDYL